MKKHQKSETSQALLFGKINYILLLIAVILVVFGFTIMSGDTNIYSTTKITIAPILVLIGFALGIYAILKTPKEK